MRSIDGTGAGVRRGTISSLRRRGRTAPEAVLEAPVDEIPRVGPKLVPRDAEPTVSIVIPAKNEARNLPYVLARLPMDGEVILVDGNSTDDTIKVAQQLRPDIIVIHQTREGKGNALACGFADQSHLTRVFTGRVGVSPGAWRRALDE